MKQLSRNWILKSKYWITEYIEVNKKLRITVEKLNEFVSSCYLISKEFVILKSCSDLIEKSKETKIFNNNILFDFDINGWKFTKVYKWKINKYKILNTENKTNEELKSRIKSLRQRLRL